MATFKVRPGFRMDLVASEPLVVDPVAVAWDEDGRMFVAEMIDYPERREQRLGRVRVLSDPDADGRYRKSQVYATDLPWVTSVCPFDGGLFAVSSPDIFYVKDTDGDGVADVRRRVFTGFAEGVARVNMQALVNNLQWGLDNRIHGATSLNGGKVRVDQPMPGRTAPAAAPVLELRNRNFNFDPRTLALAAEHGGGQHGLTYDDFFRPYVCSNSRHIQTFAYDARYGGTSGAKHVLPPAIVDIGVDGPAAEVYRASPEEPWRVIRTKWRVAGMVGGPVEGGGRASGYFTSATGITIYRGDAYGPEYAGDAFIADVGSNLIHRKKLRPDGVIVRAERAADEQKSEFVAGSDTWFRPVQFANAPDGCLYVMDMYREVIEHPWSLPPSLKKFIDLDSGSDRGRIYRMAPDGFKPRPAPRLSGATVEDLVKLLEHANGWHRDTASRLLFERRDKAAAPLLERLARESKSAPGRLHALYALDGLSALKGEHVLTALGDVEAKVRVHAVRLAERFAGTGAGGGAESKVRADLAARVRALAEDPSAEVRYQVAWTIGALGGDDAALEAVARRDTGDPWVRQAVLHAVADPARLLAGVSRGGQGAAGAAGRLELLKGLARLVAANTTAARAATDEGPRAVAGLIAAADDLPAALGIARAFVEGAEQAKVDPAAVPGWERALARVLAAARDATAPEATRAAAIEALPKAQAEAALRFLEPASPQSLQVAAIGALDRADAPGLAAELVRRWPALSPRVRDAASVALVKRPARAKALLGAVEAGRIGRTEIASTDVAALKASRDKAVKALAEKVFAAAAGRREDVVKQFMPALDLKGDAARGKAIHLAKCASCHRIGNQGSAVGPDLETVRTFGKEKLLISLLDPNREVAPNYTAYIIETDEGDQHLGLIAGETAASVTLRMAHGVQVELPRSEIKSMRSAKLSMMPEALEVGLTAQDLADLMEFVLTGG